MPDETPPAGTATPAAQPPPPAPQAQQPPQQPPAAAASHDDTNPPWLAERLERTKRDLLKEIGAENVGDVKKALADFKAKQEAEKTEAQKNAERLVELEVVRGRLQRSQAIAQARVDREMAGLSDEEKAFVRKFGGDDPIAQLDVIDSMPRRAATQPTEPAKPPPPANTSPPQNAPGASANTSPPDHKAEYLRLKATNPGAAVLYLNTYEHQIYPRA